MNHSDIVRLISGVLQLGVACYALRLGRFFGKTPLRWLLYSGVPLLALTYLFFSIGPFHTGNVGVQMDLIHGLFSVLLIAGMVQLEVLLKEHLRAEKEEHEMRSNIDSKLKQQLDDLTKANDEWPKMHEELQQTANRLETELNEHKLAVAELTKSNEDLLKASEEFQQNETKLKAEIGELNQTVAGLQQVKEASAAMNEELRGMVTSQELKITELNSTVASLESTVTQLNVTIAELTQAKEELTAATLELTQTKADLINANQELTSAREELTTANLELTNAKEELEQTVDRLQGEITELNKIQKQTEKTHRATLNALRKAAHQEGMNEVATSVLKKVTSILDGANSVSEMAARLTESRIVPLVRISKLMWKNDSKPAGCANRNPRARQARQLPDNLARLARNLSTEQTLLLKKIDTVKKKIENIKESVAADTVEDLPQTATVAPQRKTLVQPEPEEVVAAAEAVEETLETSSIETLQETVETSQEPVETQPATVETPQETLETLQEVTDTLEPAGTTVSEAAEPVEVQPQASTDYSLQSAETETATTETATATEIPETTEPELHVETETAPKLQEPEPKPTQSLFPPIQSLQPFAPQDIEDLGAESFDVDSF